jgi:hypothetical protein
MALGPFKLTYLFLTRSLARSSFGAPCGTESHLAYVPFVLLFLIQFISAP